MGRIIVDDSTRDQLAAVSEWSEHRDSAGNIIGYFAPKAEVLQPQISEEEIQRRMNEGEVYTFEEVMAHLRSL